ncbi:hypothetical protein SLH49_13270 [Cognatiyoonia sp. IB215446]|uniref:hypothetical protein n=1 Tax=Cognatiyoonia sp. IB215446 TaxID=3097355 RepID=UPI002A0ADE56|nr:hypothetical protein [Cognatiyoonia sp. IB215446]MDX8348950.1 hypothetical protein [Cognatiyoonia sp. IB215446]
MTTYAQRLCSENNVRFSQTFRYQYIVGASKTDLPGFTSTAVGRYWVGSGEGLRCRTLTDSAGVAFGLCLGIAIDHDGKTPEEVFSAGFDSASADALRKLEQYLECLAGRYAIISHLNGKTYFHCDPVGMIGAVYAPETGRIASSTFLCIDRPPIWHPLYNRDEIEAGEGTYGLNHTSDAHVFRLNASHRMELDTFRTERFWPPKQAAFVADDAHYGAIYDEMIIATRRIMTRMTTLGETSLPLSGGNDSRLLMAQADDDTLRDITQVFSHINTYANRRDAHVAAILCRAKNRPFEVHDRKKVSVPRYVRRLAERRYRIGSGTMAVVPKEIENGLFLSVRENAIVMRGHQTNIMRGQYLVTADPQEWRKPRWQIRMMQLVGKGKFNGEVAARFMPDFQRCYDDLPENALVRSADFIFFETLVPAALGTLFPGQDHAFYLSPFNSRRLVQLSMQPDTQYRMRNAPTTDVLLRADPVLAALSFAYELPADLKETQETFERRRKRVQAGLRRYAEIFGERAPEEEAMVLPLSESAEDE